MINVGIDAGSRAVKIVFFDANAGRVKDSKVIDQGVCQEDTGKTLFQDLLKKNNLKRTDISRVVATGYARNLQAFADITITEITCHSRGVRQLIPEARTIIEIGGQDSKLIRLYPDGNVQDFAMNDRCAAGTGRFLEIVASRLETSLDELGNLGKKSKNPAAINSTCVVFAETEIVSLLASGAPPEDIVAGVQNSIASRIATMAGKNLTSPLIFTGGVAMIPGMKKVLSETFGQEVQVAPEPQMTGALGAAILGQASLS